jgi:hypothetical protein
MSGGKDFLATGGRGPGGSAAGRVPRPGGPLVILRPISSDSCLWQACCYLPTPEFHTVHEGGRCRRPQPFPWLTLTGRGLPVDGKVSGNIRGESWICPLFGKNYHMGRFGCQNAGEIMLSSRLPGNSDAKEETCGGANLWKGRSSKTFFPAAGKVAANPGLMQVIEFCNRAPPGSLWSRWPETVAAKAARPVRDSPDLP